MNDTHEQILDIERGFWTRADDPRYFEDHLADGAVSVMEPMGAVDKPRAVSMVAKQPWAGVEMRDVTIREVTPDVVVLAYHGMGRQPDRDEPYRGSIASVYVRKDGRWQLALTSHQPWTPA